MTALPPLAVRHPADDERVRALVLRFYELCVQFQEGAIEPAKFFVERDDIVLQMWSVEL